jgi:hypothetical protein
MLCVRGSISVAFACGVGALAGFSETPALAQPAPPALELDWVAPAGCPSRAFVLDEVTRILGPAPSSSARPTLNVHAEAWRGESGRWHIVMTTPGEASGRREIDDVSCDSLARAAALVLALRIDPVRALHASPAGGAAPAPDSVGVPPETTPPAAADVPPPIKPESHDALPDTPAPPVVLAPASEPVSSDARDSAPHEGIRAHRRQLAVDAGVAGNAGALPYPGAGLELAIGWVPSRFRVELGGAYWLAQQATLANRPGVGGDVHSVTLEARGCYAVLAERFSLAPCAEAQVVWTSVSGFGAATPLDASAAWAALGPGLLAGWQVTRALAIRLRVDVVAPTTRPRFVIESATGQTDAVVHQPAALYGDAVLGAEVFFL